MTFHLRSGSAPLLVSIPHAGTHIPQLLRSAYVSRALALEDTDWHLDQLYSFATGLAASVLRPSVSRYVIDLNRPPDDEPMYPGASNTELCPLHFFTGDPLYVHGGAPSDDERIERRATYWEPYHQALHAELARIRGEHGFALLWDAHSIRSEIPWLFEGRLPDLNIGTADGISADASVAKAVVQAAARHPGYSQALNGRFKGGYITRHYGRPAENVHAVQLEMCQCTYMRESPPYDYDQARAGQVQPVVRELMEAALQACRELHG
jgi:N-formylglutamate deformylase